MLTPTQVMSLFDEIAETMQDAGYYEGVWEFRVRDNLVEETNMLVRLNASEDDAYHKYRLEKHGWLWRVTKTSGDLHEATSIATGFKGTLLASRTTPILGADDVDISVISTL